MMDAPSGPVSNLIQDLSTAHLHSGLLCCLQKIKLNVFLSICKSTRLLPIITIYFLLFMFSKEQNLVLLCGPDRLQSHSESTDASGVQYSSSLSLSHADHRCQPSHKAYFHFHFHLFHFHRFFFLIFFHSLNFICICYFFT